VTPSSSILQQVETHNGNQTVLRVFFQHAAFCKVKRCVSLIKAHLKIEPESLPPNPPPSSWRWRAAHGNERGKRIVISI